jgi:hypothetical protein
MRRKFFISVAALGALTAERVTLRNGFEMRCNHHAEVDGKVRLFPDTTEDSYIDFPAEEITGVEDMPDPPPTQIEPEKSPHGPAVPPLTPANLSAADLHEILARAGVEHNLDVDLLASLVKAESDGNVRAVSRTGARGLMQLMPGTAEALGVEDSFKADENVRGGSTYLDALLMRYRNNLALALAAYNAGPAAVDKYRGIPPYNETRAYVARVIHEFNKRVRARQAPARQVASAIAPEPTAAR